MLSDTLRLPEGSIASHSYLLRQEIPALQLIATENGHARWGPLIRLPRGAELHDFGAGFDEQTLLVRFEDCFYIIFRQDLAAALLKTNKRRDRTELPTWKQNCSRKDEEIPV